MNFIAAFSSDLSFCYVECKSVDDLAEEIS